MTVEFSRRSLLLTGGCALAGLTLSPMRLRAARPAIIEHQLIAAPARTALLGSEHPETAVWSYNGRTPGPEIRLRQGERVRVVLNNRLQQDTTIHWHGLRVPNGMDGAPHVTQPPVQPGESFTYEFAVPDAGTYWYHPHAHSAEQVGRGLMGAFIVEESKPLPVDREVVWVLGDWRLLPNASIAGGFNNRMEMSMAGRIGNTVTINGRVPRSFSVRSGERLRLRLINAAPARIFGLDFSGLEPLIVAHDGQPVEPHTPDGGRIVLGPAMRADLVLDMTGAPGSTSPVMDTFYDGLSYKLVDFVYAESPPVRSTRLDPPTALPPNTMPEPALPRAQRHEVTFSGGMMGGGGMAGMMSMMSGGPMWAVNGVAAHGHDMKPILTLDYGRSYVVAVKNDTAWHHPIHLHGHSFRVVSRNGRPTRYREWRDTVLLAPRERAEIAFVADNPGDWMFHCHVLDHQEGGMMSVIRVA